MKIKAANGTAIACHGETYVEITLPKRRTFPWTVIVADILNPILGADFLSHYELLVDCSKSKLLDRNTNLETVCKISCATVKLISVNDLGKVSELARPILKKYPLLCSPRYNPPSPCNTKVKHFIETSDRPVFAKVRKLGPEKLAAAKKEFSELINKGIIRPSSSPWASPIHMVPKSGINKWRVCGDYRSLNLITKPDRYPIPNIHSVTTKLAGKNVFSKIDLMHAYHQIPVNELDIEKTAVITPFGLFEYLMMPFGLRNSGATFQRFMDDIFRDLDFIFVYMDDILVFSNTNEQHVIHLEKIFKILEKTI